MEFKDNQAIYLQIANHFFENILQKKWNAGEKVPSIRELAIQFEVNPNTTMRTFGYLQDKGIIFNKRGLGYYVTEDGYKKVVEIKAEHFINEELPAVFRNMKLLGLGLEDIQRFYEKNNKTK